MAHVRGRDAAPLTGTKDKLRRQLRKDMDLACGSVGFSSQCADRCTMVENGR